MYYGCSYNCLRAALKLKNEEIFIVIRTFVNKLDLSTVNKTIIDKFYINIKRKYNIECEVGMIFVESLLMTGIYDSFFYQNDFTNIFINNKLELYQWIKPEHLEIKEIIADNIIGLFKNIGLRSLPSVKLNYFMKAVQNLYKYIGQNKSQDMFFPCVVFCMLKAQIKDIYLHVKFMKLFSRKYESQCKTKSCTHGFSIPICCMCMFRNEWNGQESYYLTMADAALQFIMTIEFYNLKITKNEFNDQLEKRLSKLNISNSIKKKIN